MSPALVNRRPSFFWQGLLILLPVGLLAVASAWAIRRDRLLVEEDARQQAQDMVNGISESLGPELGDRFDRLANGKTADGIMDGLDPDRDVFGPVRLSEDGRPAAPALPPAIPSPPAWTTVPGSETSPDAQAHAAFQKLLADAPKLSPPDFANRLLHELEKHGRGASESGLPLGAIAFSRLLDLLPDLDVAAQRRLAQQSSVLAETVSPQFMEVLVQRSSAGTNSSAVGRSPLLDEILRNWNRSRRTITLAQALEKDLGSGGRLNHPVWIGSSTHRFLAWRMERMASEGVFTGRSPSFAFISDKAVRRVVETAPALAALRLPAHLALSIQIEGNPISPEPRLEGSSRPAPLATATADIQRRLPLKSKLTITDSGPLPNNPASPRALLDHAGPEASLVPGDTGFSASGAPGTSFQVPRPGPADDTARPARLSVSIGLIDRGALFGRATSRALLMGGLTLLAAATAVFGFVLARRAFHRQLALNEQKSNFVSAVSHELRAPIAAVRLMTENLVRGAPAEPVRQRAYFGLILQECRRLSSLIENVLDFSRIEQGRKEYDPEPTDLAALVRATVQLMEPVAADHGVRVACSVGRASLPGQSAVCDGRAIQQALVNLLDNAIKHSPAGTEIVVALGAGPAVSESLFLSVTDHGPGIPSDERTKVFDRFYRRGSELRRETQGVGIGLSIVKSIVEAHGGRVWIEAAPDGGCRAVIELPAGSPT